MVSSVPEVVSSVTKADPSVPEVVSVVPEVVPSVPEVVPSVPSVPEVVSASLYMSTDNSPVTSNIPDNLESTDKELEDILKDFNNSFSEGSLTGPTLNSKPNKKSKKHRD